MKIYEIKAGKEAYSCKEEVLHSTGDALLAMADAQEGSKSNLKARTLPEDPMIFNLEEMVIDPVYATSWLERRYKPGSFAHECRDHGYYGFVRKGVHTDQMYVLLVHKNHVNLLA